MDLVDAVQFLFQWGILQPRPKWELTNDTQAESRRFEQPEDVVAQTAELQIDTRSEDAFDRQNLWRRGNLKNGTQLGEQAAEVDCLIFLIVNGREIDRLDLIGHGESRRRGGLTIEYNGWYIRCDQTPNDSLFSSLRQEHFGQAATHVCEFTRVDGSTFPVETARALIGGIETLFSFAACRSAGAALPIALIDGKPRWVELWTPVSNAWTGTYSWLDPIFGADQFRHAIPCWLNAWSSTHLLRAIQGYHTDACSSNPIDSSIAVAMSGLLLIGDLERSKRGVSTNDWSKGGTARQIRRLLRWGAIDHGMIDHYPELAKVSWDKYNRIIDAQDPKYDSYAARRPPDLVDGIIDMRNAIIHPSADGRRLLKGPALRQGWRVVTEWLTLSILFYIGYSETYASRLTPHVRSSGEVIKVPWSSG